MRFVLRTAELEMAKALRVQGAVYGSFDTSPYLAKLACWLERSGCSAERAVGCGRNAVAPVLKHGPRSLAATRVRRC